MAKGRGDISTLSLLDWQPPAVAKTFSPDRVAGHNDGVRMARAFAEAIRDSGLDRNNIHERMQAYMGRKFSRATLDRVTAPSAEEHEFTTSKVIAFLKVVSDLRVINELLAGTGFVAIPEKYLGAIEQAICDEQIQQLQRRRRMATKKWKGPGA